MTHACKLLTVVAVLIASGEVLAESVAFTFPESGAPSIQSSLTLQGEATTNRGYGYRDVRLTFEAPIASPADRSLTVRFALSAFSGEDLSVEQDLDFPAGATTATMVMSVPKFLEWDYFDVEVWVDAVQDRGVGGRVNVTTPRGGPQRLDVLRGKPNGAPPVLLFPDSPQRQGRRRGGEWYRIAIECGDLPEQWKTLSGYEAVLLSLPELSNLANDHPEKLKVLRRWVNAGGTLFVEKVGLELKELPEVERILDLGRNPFDIPLARALQDEVLAEQAANEEVGAEDDSPTAVPPEAPPLDDAPHWSWARIRLPLGRPDEPPTQPGGENAGRRFGNLPAWFAKRPFGFGAVVAFPDQFTEPSIPGAEVVSLFPGYREVHKRFLTGAMTRNLHQYEWARRHGLEPNVGNDKFSNWLIPGVGAAPVDAFRWLITLFVLLVGPVSFFVLRSRQRTHLMVLTAPAVAIVFTLGLYVYATIADGFGTRLRARSVTLIDQPLGEFASWSRQSYYAGMAPAEGLSFPRSAVVYPLLPNWKEGGSDDESSVQREILIEGDHQRLTEGWLRSRETTQYLVIDVGENDARLEVNAKDSQVTVTNQLGAELERLYVVDESAQWWEVEDVEQGEQARLDPADRRAAELEIRTLIGDAAPAFPPGLESGGWSRGPSRRRTQTDSYDDPLLDYGQGSGGGGRLESLIGLVSGMDSGMPVPLAAGTYLAVSRTTTQAPVGLDHAKEEGSLHVTIGRWAP